MKLIKLSLEKIKIGMNVVVDWSDLRKDINISSTYKDGVYKVIDIKNSIVCGGRDCKEAKCPGKIQLEGISERCYLYPSSPAKTPFYEHFSLYVFKEEDFLL